MSLAIYRMGHLIGEESRRQSVSYTASLAHLIMGRLKVNQARPLHLPECHVVLATMETTPPPQVRTGVWKFH